MAGCQWFFDPADFDASREAEIVHRVRKQGFLSPESKKALLLCWFDTVYGSLVNGRADVVKSRDNLRRFISESGHPTLESWLAAE